MLDGWRYRAVSFAGTVWLAVAVASISFAATGRESSLLALALVALVVGPSMRPMYRPRPWRTSTLVSATLRRVLLACAVLVILGATVTPALGSSATVAGIGVGLATALPLFYVGLRRRPEPTRVLVVGDDPDAIESIVGELPADPIGFASPRVEVDGDAAAGVGNRRRAPIDREVPRPIGVPREPGTSASGTDSLAVTDGSGTLARSPYDGILSLGGIDRLGGLVRLRRLVRRYDVDTLALAFRDADRGEFFGALEVAHEYGMDVFVHASLADNVLVSEDGDELARAEVDPWPWYTHVTKRVFDVAFAAVGLLVLAPLAFPIAVSIKLDSSGPVLYRQTRTSAFGERFHVLKFRTMTPGSEDPEPQEDVENDRITRVGRVLRKTHVDEIPQLWSVLLGDMSVVGPRATWIDEERLLEGDVDGWRTRWHVKPGLTGLAQVNDVTSTAGGRKLELDLGYVTNHSFALDLRIIARQVWIVLADVGELIHQRTRRWRS
ncbi:sugar transferase [Halovivax gelatinilyticus]|uniref:sugar transferase n=1 Tax=Halovivax gelatinilyticus TaxID=2961597 RepID=UPI0020CA55AB|nr:sugar transferase [Halovivax gelatinilyticus]